MNEWDPLLETDWGPLLGPEFAKPYWKNLQSFVKRERLQYEVYPPPDEVFRALLLTSYARTKVVVLGQDPYHGAGQAHGLAFSVPCGVAKPPSLGKIHRELNEDLGSPIPNHGNLEEWARQGVLLLNTTLTVRAGAPGSQQGEGWETFTSEVIQVINGKPVRVVFLLWGQAAQQKCALIDTSRHTVICSSHPSPLAAAKGCNPFLTSRAFSRANRALTAAGIEEIDWRLSDCPESDTD